VREVCPQQIGIIEGAARALVDWFEQGALSAFGGSE
jgi:hypothetical protein